MQKLCTDKGGALGRRRVCAGTLVKLLRRVVVAGDRSAVIKTVFLAARSGGCFKRHGFRGEVAFVNWNQSTRAERQALALSAPPSIDCYPASSSSTALHSLHLQSAIYGLVRTGGIVGGVPRRFQGRIVPGIRPVFRTFRTSSNRDMSMSVSARQLVSKVLRRGATYMGKTQGKGHCCYTTTSFAI